jgi:hypothetical protein
MLAQLRNGGVVAPRRYTHAVTLPDGAVVRSSGIALPDGRTIWVCPTLIRSRASAVLLVGRSREDAQCVDAWSAEGWDTRSAPLPGPFLRGSGGVRLWIEASHASFDEAKPTIITSHWQKGRDRSASRSRP